MSPFATHPVNGRDCTDGMCRHVASTSAFATHPIRSGRSQLPHQSTAEIAWMERKHPCHQLRRTPSTTEIARIERAATLASTSACATHPLGSGESQVPRRQRLRWHGLRSKGGEWGAGGRAENKEAKILVTSLSPVVPRRPPARFVFLQTPTARLLTLAHQMRAFRRLITRAELAQGSRHHPPSL